MNSKSRPRAVATVQIDNARTTVTEWRFVPGAETGWHQHTMDYVVLPMTSGQLMLEAGQKEQTSNLTAGVSYYRERGVTHNVVNANDYEFVFIETEFK